MAGGLLLVRVAPIFLRLKNLKKKKRKFLIKYECVSSIGIKGYGDSLPGDFFLRKEEKKLIKDLNHEFG